MMNKSILNNVRLFIGPMSKNIVDSVIEFCDLNNVLIGLIPSRRQTDCFSGYNGWTTRTLADYVRNKTNYVILERDHGGPKQGDTIDQGYDSFCCDSENFDLIHVDVWKQEQDIFQAAKLTARYIKFCREINPRMLFEVGTEESIRKMDYQELYDFLADLKHFLTEEEFESIVYVVVQFGTKLQKNVNTGHFDREQAKQMINTVNMFNKLTKTHNGDYLSNKHIKENFDLGISSINIAPEMGLMETEVLLSVLNSSEKHILFNSCYDSKRWVKWVPRGYNPFENEGDLMRICGHYVLNNNEIKNITINYPEIKELVREKVFNKLAGVLL